METVKYGKPSNSGGLKSPFSIETLLISLLDDLSTSNGLPITDNDRATIKRRLASEGPQFAYVTLKTLQSDLLGLLEYGAIPKSDAFASRPGSRIPKFLGNLWERLVDQNGQILPDLERDPAAAKTVAAILQVGTSFSKYEDGAPLALRKQFLDEFVAVDRALSSLEFPPELISRAANVITEVFSKFSLRTIKPKHGPGAVATGERDERKWAFKRLVRSANRFYPFYDYFVAGRHSMEPSELVEAMGRLVRVDSGTAKLLLVPKTTTSWRSISMEPLELMFLQQGQMASLVRHLQLHPLTRGKVNFEYQDKNRQLALVNSATREMGTMDLSSASDRLSLELVKRLFTNVDENVLCYLLATRSSHTMMPDGSLLELNKFAPMGSATCFPVQSICFFALCVAGLQIHRQLPLYVAAQQVYVYGDDIVVPSESMRLLSDELESVGLKVNRAKSFSRGFFRESCGMFAFAGVDVTPLRFAKSFPRTKGDGRGIASWLAYAHDCELRGYFKTAEYIYTKLEVLTGILPYGLEGCGYFCRLSPNAYELATQMSGWPHIRVNEDWQTVEIKALGLHTPKRDVDFQSPWDRLLRDLLTDFSMNDPSITADGRAAKPKSTWHPLV